MIVEIDGKKLNVTPTDSVKIILDEGDYERHVNVTHEGVIVDLVKDGEVIDSTWREHNDLLTAPDE